MNGKFTLREVADMWSLLSEETKKELHELPCTGRIGFHKVPTNLQHITYGELLSLMQMRDDNITTTPFEVLTDIPKKSIPNLNAKQSFGFLNMVGKELTRIGKLFESCIVPPTPEQIKAGIEDIPSSPFNTVDWYARRMGITNHDEVLAISWQRIYACAKIDAENAKYERRYSDVVSASNKN